MYNEARLVLQEVPMLLAAAALLASFAVDLVAHGLGWPDLEELAHLAGLLSMVALVVVILVQGNRVKGEPHAHR